MSYKYKLGFIGAGNMAWAIARRLVKARLYEGSELVGGDGMQVGVIGCEVGAEAAEGELVVADGVWGAALDGFGEDPAFGGSGEF